jgi:hypothetical protein
MLYIEIRYVCSQHGNALNLRLEVFGSDLSRDTFNSDRFMAEFLILPRKVTRYYVEYTTIRQSCYI